MNQLPECAICLDDIDFTTGNCVKTECNHCFHTSCLMRNIAHNGFDCPCCRTEMAEAVDDSDDDDDEDDDEDDDDDNYLLRGFRLFMNNVEGVEQDEEDVLEEQQDDFVLSGFRSFINNAEGAEQDESRIMIKPSPQVIVQRLTAEGITMLDMVKILLRDHDEYSDEDSDYIETDDKVWDKMRNIIETYHQTVQIPTAVAVAVLPENYDYQI